MLLRQKKSSNAPRLQNALHHKRGTNIESMTPNAPKPIIPHGELNKNAANGSNGTNGIFNKRHKIVMFKITRLMGYLNRKFKRSLPKRLYFFPISIASSWHPP